MTICKTALVGLDEGKAIASARRGGRRDARVPGRFSSPPAKSDGQAAATTRSPLSDRRGRLADVGGHSMSAGPGQRPAFTGDLVRAWSAEGLQRSRSSATWLSSRRRSDVSRAAAVGRNGRILSTFGTNRELPDVGLTRTAKGALRPPVTCLHLVQETTSRRRGRGRWTRRRDAQPVRSGGRRGGCGEGDARPSQAGSL
mgnify:FL=1